jgi:hypothetical protein
MNTEPTKTEALIAAETKLEGLQKERARRLEVQKTAEEAHARALVAYREKQSAAGWDAVEKAESASKRAAFDVTLLGPEVERTNAEIADEIRRIDTSVLEELSKTTGLLTTPEIDAALAEAMRALATAERLTAEYTGTLLERRKTCAALRARLGCQDFMADAAATSPNARYFLETAIVEATTGIALDAFLDSGGSGQFFTGPWWIAVLNAPSRATRRSMVDLIRSAPQIGTKDVQDGMIDALREGRPGYDFPDELPSEAKGTAAKSEAKPPKSKGKANAERPTAPLEVTTEEAP